MYRIQQYYMYERVKCKNGKIDSGGGKKKEIILNQTSRHQPARTETEKFSACCPSVSHPLPYL